MIVAAGYAALIFRAVPWWLWPPLVLLTAGTALQITAAILRIRVLGGMKRFDPKKLKDLGRALSEFSRSSTRTLRDWEAQNPSPDRVGASPLDNWHVMQRHSQARAMMFREYHFPQSVAYLATLYSLEIYPPFHTMSAADARPDGLVAYLGAVGHLLESGLIEEAKSLRGRDDGRPPQFGFHLLS